MAAPGAVQDFPIRATRTGGANSFPVFNVMCSYIEKRMGTRLQRGGLYHLVGSIDGVFDFDIYRIIKNYARIIIPLEFRDKAEFGKVYNFRLESIEEVPLNDKQREIIAKSVGLQYRPLLYRLGHADTRTDGLDPRQFGEPRKPMAAEESQLPQRMVFTGVTFSLVTYLHSRHGNRKYLRIPNSAFEEKTGLKLEEMRDYVIRGRLDKIGTFQKSLLRCAARQDVPIYLSAELSNKVEIGKRYEVSVESIEKFPERKPWDGIDLRGVRPWNWEQVGIWVDTEGAICHTTERGGNNQVIISQKERRVLAEIAFFLQSQGVNSAIRLRVDTGVYALHVTGVEQVAKVIKEIEPFIRTVNKIEEIAEFRKYLAVPRRHLAPEIRNARALLGVPQN